MGEYKVVEVFVEWAYTEEFGSYQRVSGLGIEFTFENQPITLKIKKSVVIDKIEKESRKFFVEGGGEKAYLEVATHPKTGLKYVRTIKDKTPLDNLSALPKSFWSGPWDTPLIPVEIPFEWEGRELSRWYDTEWPSSLDDVGCAPDCEQNTIAIGYFNYYDGSAPIGSIGHNNLCRGLIKPDLNGLDNQILHNVRISLKKHQTINQSGPYASNVGSALHSVWRLYAPWGNTVDEFIAPGLMAGLLIYGVPTLGGELDKQTPWGKEFSASYDPATQLVVLDVTEVMELWRKGTIPNYGLMLLGTDESENYDNNAFYSCYEILNIHAYQEYDW